MVTHVEQGLRASVEERQAALAKEHPAWAPRTLDAMLDRAARTWPDRPFVVTNGRSWTYRQMEEWSKRLAAGLAEVGLRPGEHVALLLPNHPEFVAIKFAVARAGAVAVPLNVLNRRDELAYLLQQSDAAMLITIDGFRDVDFLAALDELAPGWEACGGGTAFPKLRRVFVLSVERELRPNATPLAAIERANLPVPENAAALGDIADIIYTSGTTGSPKGVLLTHDMLLRTAYAAAFARAFEDGRRILFALPMYHVFGYVEGLLPVLFVGGSIVPQIRFDPVRFVDAIERHRPTDLLMIPAMTLGVLDAAPGRDLSSVRAILASGGRAPKRVWDSMDMVFGRPEVTTGYGMTECTASTTVTRPDDPPARVRTTNGRLRIAGVAGDPELGGRLVVYRVVDPQTREQLPPGAVGELMAKGPGVTAGYYAKPAETAAAFDAEGWLHTGDLGSVDEDGYLVLAGRLKESYRCGGEQVLPGEVEDLLTTHPEVLQAHVVPLPDERMGEVGVAFIVAADGARVTPETLAHLCADRLARFKVPRHVLMIAAEDVPTTASGRGRKFMLVERARTLLGAS